MTSPGINRWIGALLPRREPAMRVLRASGRGKRREPLAWWVPAARLSSSRVDWLAQPISQIWHKIVSAVLHELFQLCFSRCAGLADLPQGFRTTNYVRDWLSIRTEQCAKRVSRKSRWSRIIREADREPVSVVGKRHGISGQTIYTWRKRFGGWRRNNPCRENPATQKRPYMPRCLPRERLDVRIPDVIGAVAHQATGYQELAIPTGDTQ